MRMRSILAVSCANGVNLLTRGYSPCDIWSVFLSTGAFSMPKPGRNDLCPCGSGRKYKNCCLQKDLEAEKEKAETVVSDEPYEENPAPKFATWKIFAAVTLILSTIALIIWLAFDQTRIAGTIWGVGMLILVVYSAFRNEPTLRKEPGDAGNIDFGNRQGIQPVKKNKK